MSQVWEKLRETDNFTVEGSNTGESVKLFFNPKDTYEENSHPQIEIFMDSLDSKYLSIFKDAQELLNALQNNVKINVDFSCRVL